MQMLVCFEKYRLSEKLKLHVSLWSFIEEYENIDNASDIAKSTAIHSDCET